MSNAIYIVHTEFELTLKQTIKYVKLKRSVQLEELGVALLPLFSFSGLCFSVCVGHRFFLVF